MSYHVERGIDMTIETHVTDRKALARQIAELLHEEVAYAGVPSCAYKIGAVTIDRGGAIHTDVSIVLATLKPFLIEQGYIASEPETTEQKATATQLSASDIGQMEISVPAEGMSVTALKNLIFMLYSKQHLLNRAIGQEVFHISDEVVARLSEYTPESSEAFTQLLDDFRARGEVDGVDFRDGQVTLRFPFETVKPEEWAVYGELTAGIIKAAMNATRVSPKRQHPENEKYFMHSWLIRLGFDGPEHKTLRKLLLQNLRGYCAFRSDEEAQKHREKYAEIRRAYREGQVKAE
jgi:hypothetical protein